MLTIITEIQHVYLDAATLFQFLSDNPDYRANLNSSLEVEAGLFCQSPVLKAAHPWKHDRRAVCQLTFNAQCQLTFRRAKRGLIHLAYSRFPQLTTVNLVGLIMDIQNPEYFRMPLSDTVGWHLRSDPVGRTVAVTLKKCVVPAFPFSFEYLAGWTAFDEYRHRCVAIPDVTLDSMDELVQRYDAAYCNGLAWPYPDSQLDWLARWAPSVNDDRRLRNALLMRDGPFSPIFMAPTGSSRFDLEYCHQLNGPARNMMAVHLLQLKPPGMAPPPVAFQFEKLRLRKNPSP